MIKTKAIAKGKILNIVSKTIDKNIEFFDQLENQRIQFDLLEILRNIYEKNGLITDSEFELAKTSLQSNFISIRKLAIIIISLHFKWSKNK